MLGKLSQRGNGHRSHSKGERNPGLDHIQVSLLPTWLLAHVPLGYPNPLSLQTEDLCHYFPHVVPCFHTQLPSSMFKPLRAQHFFTEWDSPVPRGLRHQLPVLGEIRECGEKFPCCLTWEAATDRPCQGRMHVLSQGARTELDLKFSGPELV